MVDWGALVPEGIGGLFNGDGTYPTLQRGMHVVPLAPNTQLGEEATKLRPTGGAWQLLCAAIYNVLIRGTGILSLDQNRVCSKEASTRMKKKERRRVIFATNFDQEGQSEDCFQQDHRMTIASHGSPQMN